jgi:hypothetical protein
MTPLIRQDDPAAQEWIREVAAGGTLIPAVRLALTPTGAGIEAAITAASAPPLSGGPDNHDSEATHAFTIADSVGRTGSQPAEGPLSAVNS